MPREYLTEVLNEIAKVTSILVETSNIKECLDSKCHSDEDIKSVLERTKIEVESLSEVAAAVSNLFFNQYKEVCEKLKTKKSKNSKENSNGVSTNSNSLESEDAPNTSVTTRPLIKLVDINKLVEPSKAAKVKKEIRVQQKNVKCDDTVVVITSSDDEAPKVPKGRQAPQRKAALETIKKTRLLVQLPSDAESDLSDSDARNKKSGKVKNGSKISRNDHKIVLSDTSNLSDASTNGRIYKRSQKVLKRKTNKKTSEENQQEPEWKNDVKFNSKCFVKVVRIPYEELKHCYLERLELLEIKKLCNMNSLKRKRRVGREVEKSSDTDNEQDGVKRKKCMDNSEGVNKTARPSSGNISSDKQNQEDSSATEDDLIHEGSSQKTNLAESSSQETDNDKKSEEAKKAEIDVDPNKNDQVSTENDPTVLEKGIEEMAELAVEQLNSKEGDRANSTKEDSTTSDGSDKEVSSKTKTSKRKNNVEISQHENSDGEKSKETRENSDHGDHETLGEKEEQNNKDVGNSKKPLRKDKLLTMRLTSSDSEEELQKVPTKKKKKEKENASTDEDEAPKKKANSTDEDEAPKKKANRHKKKRMKKAILSDSESDYVKGSGSDPKHTEESESSSESEKESEAKKKPARKRVKEVRDSSDEDDLDKSTRKQIRHILGRSSLAETTKQAEAEERERKARIVEKQKKYNQVYEGSLELNATVEKVVLDFDEKSNKELLKVDDVLVSKLKPHQASGIQFMWDACFESLERAQTTKGSGCILAHCMGLGKTLQVIALTHALLLNAEKTKVRQVLVVSPYNIVLNWVSEYRQWLPDCEDYDVYELVSTKQNYDRQYTLQTWQDNGGVLIIGYDMFRNLSNPENKRLSRKMRGIFHAALANPGPDLVICDEGHLLKNEKTNLSIAMNRLKTMRRIVLTGTPLQNNLREYFCMVQFIKPNLLGTYKEYLNRFVNPITNGQYTDSTPHDIQIMRNRSHVLHKMLDGVVQRRDYSVLQPYLPPKHEYVVFLQLSDTQIKLYQHYMDHFARNSVDASNRTAFLFTDSQALQRICTHPRVLLDKSVEMKLAKFKAKMDDSEEDSEGSLKDFIDDDEDTSSNSNSSSDEGKEKSESVTPRKRMTRAARALAKENGEVDDLPIEIKDPEVDEKEWWQEYCDGDELNNIEHSAKLVLLFEILKECEQIGDKVLVFSQSLYSLNIIEYFLERIHDATQEGKTACGYSGSWCTGLDYFRLDGSSSCDNRSVWCKIFNDPSNTRARLFLISTRAGGLGINLVAANRVIIFDVSWNPSHDIQSIYRIYRFGQTKPCYIYRFVTYGTMEMKVYERQVTKQAISKRVIDEQQIDRHYNQNDLQELYRFDPKPNDRPTPLVPKDVLLGELLQNFEDRIYKYHEHQSLLENKEDEVLNEEERKAAWEEFENEKIQRNTFGNTHGRITNMEIALANILRKDHPTWNEIQIKTMIPALHLQLQDQVSKGDLTLYRRVQQEIQLQMLQNRKLKEQMFQQQVARMLQQQQMAAAMRQQNPNSYLGQYLQQMPGTSQAQLGFNPNEVIDLND